MDEELSRSAFRKNGTNQDATKSANCSTYCRRRSSHVRLNLPTRSAPTSGFSSPAISPRRLGTSDLHSIISSNLAKSRRNCCRRLSLDVNTKSAIYTFNCISSPKSDPTTGLSSPAVSPEGSHVAELSNSLVTPQESQICSALESVDLGRITASHGYQVPSAKSAHSPDVSPFDNLTGQSSHLRPRWPNKLSFPLNHKLLTGIPWQRLDFNSHVSAHPLPLPPGAAPSQPFVSSPLAVLQNATERPNMLPRKTHWQKGKLIGRGMYGSVYVGTNRETGALCAMKEVCVVPDDPQAAECIRQLEQEIRVLRNLKHPNIVQYYGSEMVDDRFYIYMEYVHPGSVNKYVQEHCGDITESIVRNFTRHILSGLAYLHGTETIHRDIKGANLLVDSSGVVKLADFGMAKHLAGMSYDLSLKGSPHWMAPEVIKAVIQKDASPNLALAVDIWSLGCTVIEMFTGKPPWGELQGVSP
uniref:mitogen-activated protein kinase kinase kinase n=1 Tax=Rhizophora mucronata TaxID=61149 RepID=A0A2P2LPC1_RHIMU